jgi:hypothetical protein
LNPKEPTAGVTLGGKSTLLDLGPTLLGLSGLEVPSTFEGRRIDELEKNPPASGEHLFLSLSPHLPVFCLERGGKKLLLRPMQQMKNFWTGNLYSAMHPMEAYDRNLDPGEKKALGVDQAWTRAFSTDLDWLVPEGFPDALIVRLPPSAGAVAFRAKVGSRCVGVTTIGGADPLPIAMTDQDRVAEAIIPASSNPQWLSLRPEQFGDGTELTLRFERHTSVVTNDGSSLPSGSATLN